MKPRDIDEIIAAVTRKHPHIKVKQLQVKFPGADDDGLWFFGPLSSPRELQLESSDGMYPFIVETDRHNQVGHVSTLVKAVSLIESWLDLAGAG